MTEISGTAQPEKKTVYTIVAYRANGVDICRGCVMGRSDSEHEVTVFTDMDAAAQKVAEYRWQNKTKNDFAVCEWDTTVLVDGWTEYEYPDNSDSWIPAEDPWGQMITKTEAAYRQIELADAAKKRREDEDAVEKAAAAEAQQKIDQEMAERRMLDVLKSKYETA